MIAFLGLCVFSKREYILPNESIQFDLVGIRGEYCARCHIPIGLLNRLYSAAPPMYIGSGYIGRAAG